MLHCERHHEYHYTGIEITISCSLSATGLCTSHFVFFLLPSTSISASSGTFFPYPVSIHRDEVLHGLFWWFKSVVYRTVAIPLCDVLHNSFCWNDAWCVQMRSTAHFAVPWLCVCSTLQVTSIVTDIFVCVLGLVVNSPVDFRKFHVLPCPPPSIVFDCQLELSWRTSRRCTFCGNVFRRCKISWCTIYCVFIVTVAFIIAHCVAWGPCAQCSWTSNLEMCKFSSCFVSH